MNQLTGYLGTYASPDSPGIFRFTLNLENGVLSVPELYYRAPDCKYLSLDSGLLAAPFTKDGQAGICLLYTCPEGATPAGEAFHETSAACYITQDQNRIYTANYHEGTVLVYQKTAAGPRLIRRIDISPGAGCHQVLFHDHYMLVPCLLLDFIRIFDCDRDFQPVGEFRFDPGSGPRHGIFNRNHSYFYLVSELSNQVFVYPMEDFPHIKPAAVYPLLPDEASYQEPPTSAAIRLSPDERHLYVSTRYADIITVFRIDGGRLEQIQQTGSGGIHPRDIILTPDGRYLLAANRTQGGLVCFPIDPESGLLLPDCSRVPAPEAVSIALSAADH